MSVVGAQQISAEIAGGLVTLNSPEDLPPGASPFCTDLEFLPGIPGTIRTRPGLFGQHQFPGNVTINYARTFKDQQQNIRNLEFDSAQNLWQEFPQGIYALIGEPALGVTPTIQSSYVKSDTAFGREWMAFSDGKFGGMAQTLTA